MRLGLRPGCLRICGLRPHPGHRGGRAGVPGPLGSLADLALDGGDFDDTGAWATEESLSLAIRQIILDPPRSEGFPWRRARIDGSRGGFDFGDWAYVRVTGRWGWPSVPAPVTHSATLLAIREYQGLSAALGVIVSEASIGYLPQRDRALMARLQPYRRTARAF